MGELLALVAAGCFGLSNLFARLATDHLNRDLGFLLSQVANAAVLGTLALGVLAVRGTAGFSTPAMLFFILGGVCATLIGRWANLHSLHRLGPSRSSMYKNTQALMTTALAVVVLREPVTWSTALGAGLVLAGVWSVTSEPAAAAGEAKWGIQPGYRAIGIAWGTLAAAAYAVGNILRKLGMNLWPQPAVGAGVAACSALTGSFLNPRVWSQLRLLRPPWHRGHVYFLAFGLCTAGAQLSFFSALRFAPVWIVNAIMASEPLLTMVLSVVIFRGRERLGRWVLAGAALVVTGLVVLAT